MGKGKRNRDSRKQAVKPELALERLLEVKTKDEFLTLVGDRPELIGDRVRHRLAEMITAPYGQAFERLKRLVDAAQSDPVAAWEDYSESLTRDTRIGEEIGKVIDEAREAEARHEPEKVIDLAESAVRRALDAGLVIPASILEAMRAHAFLIRPSGSRQDNVDKAISGFGRALTMTVIPDEAARLNMHIGIAMAERLRGDPADNLESALNALRNGLEILPPDGSPDLRATIQTNIATSLLRRQRGEKLENLNEALALCQEVLEYRSIDREPDEWAIVQLNYAPVLLELAQLGEADPAEARTAYEEVIENGSLIDEDRLANAHYQLGRMLRVSAAFNPEKFVEDWDPDERDEVVREEDSADKERLLAEAQEHLETAIRICSKERSPRQVGRAFAELADVFNQQGNLQEAAGAAEKGLELLPPTSGSRECARVAGRLGDALALQGIWDRAAAAFRVAVEAAELSFHSRLDADFRAQEAKSTLNLTRWAAFAMAAAGNTPEALMVLESGRARDLRLRLGLGDGESRELSDLPNDLRLRYVEATNDLARSPLGEAGAAATRALQEVLRDIREVAGFESFATRPHESDLLGALEPDWPVLFVNPTPYGTLLLLLEESSGDATVHPIFLDEPTSLEVFMRLLAGDGADESELADAAEYGSYLAGASGFSDSVRDVQEDVEHVLPWLGESFAEPINDILREVGAQGVTLVLCGPVALAPLHAAPWIDSGSVCYLVDDFEVRHAPSATFAAASLSRADGRDRVEPSLVALINPENNLSAAPAEFEGIGRLFDGHINAAMGSEAGWSFLRSHAEKGSFLHLACHARSGVWGESLPAVILSDGDVEVTQLAELPELRSRLVTVSACQSAVIDITQMPEEAVSVATVLTAKGAACVVASLWPVRDDTTALMMIRLYEEILKQDLRPPEALRRAQLWLRDLTDQELDAFLQSHPSLAAEFQRRAALGDRPGRRSPAADAGRGGVPEKPFSGPDYWAPFIAIGA
jgi:CHAT domain-containing protein/tetratricopeptide (TPR) repeat protein